jgi:hypothetical protein
MHDLEFHIFPILFSVCFNQSQIITNDIRAFVHIAADVLNVVVVQVEPKRWVAAYRMIMAGLFFAITIATDTTLIVINQPDDFVDFDLQLFFQTRFAFN